MNKEQVLTLDHRQEWDSETGDHKKYLITIEAQLGPGDRLNFSASVMVVAVEKYLLFSA